jgi:hypothetical protein
MADNASTSPDRLRLQPHPPSRIRWFQNLPLRRSIGKTVIDRVSTTVSPHPRPIDDHSFATSDYDIHWLERFVEAS